MPALRRDFLGIYLVFTLSLAPVNWLAAAQKPPVSIDQAEVGFAGNYKSGFWTPVWLTLTAGDAPIQGVLQLIAPDGDQVPVIHFAGGEGKSAQSLDLPAGQSTTVLAYVKAGPERSRISARVIEPASGKLLWQSKLPESVSAPLTSTRPLIVGIGPSIGITEAIRFLRRSDDSQIAAAEVTSASRLPDQWWGYEGVECIILTTGEGSLLDSLSTTQAAALEQWVRMGGKLVLSVGSRGAKVLATDSPWKRLVPGKLVRVAPLRDGAGLQTAGGEPFPLPDDASRPDVAELTDFPGELELVQGGLGADLPLIIRSPYGFGEITLLTLDLEDAKLAKWSGRSRLISRLIQGPDASTSQAPSRSSTGGRLGYSDLVGQLRAALERFPGVSAINFTTVSLLCLSYILLIGPVDFLLLRRLNLPRWLTWIIFPALATAYCGIAWLYGEQAHGTELCVNQAEIVDVDIAQQSVRGTAWTHIYSPATRTLNLTLRVDDQVISGTQPVAHWTTWQGLPGTGLGGLSSGQLATVVIDPYATSSPGTTAGVSDLPVQIAATKSLSTRWWGKADVQPISLKLNEFGLISGQLTNPLDVDLRDCLLTYNIWLYRLKTLRAGETIQLSEFPPLNLEARLQQRVLASSKDVATPWLRDSTDVPAIMQMLMFHEAARGQSYTNLTHRYQPYLDLTPQLQRGRAILAGRADMPAAKLLVDGESVETKNGVQSWTYYRVVIPTATANKNQVSP